MKQRYVLAAASLISLYCVVLFFSATSLIRGSGQWYSQSMIYRSQTEAMMSGRIYLSSDQKTLTYDEVFIGGKVQQVWGLGAPILRLPFELVARLSGFKAFPDRLVLGFYLWLASFVVFLSVRSASEKHGLKPAYQIISASIFSITACLLPAIIALGRTRFVVYEEAILYGYIVSIIMLAVVPVLDRKRRWIVLPFVFFCGLSGFFRPTTLIYGAISSVVLLLASETRWRKIEIVAVFFIGCVIFGASNYSRFGNAFEFGHRINVDADSLNIYQLKFGSPFVKTPVISAAKELTSALFLNPKMNDSSSLYNRKFFAGEADILRWRNFYSKTFSLQDLVVLLISLGIFFWFVFRRGFNKALRQDFLFWSLTSFALLFGFYLYSPSLSSRYLADFSASILGMIFAIFFFALSLKISWKKYVAFGIICLYLALAIYADHADKRKKIASQALTFERIEKYLSPRLQKNLAIGSSYNLNEKFDKYGIFTNGTGWNTKTGEFKSSVLIFAKNMEYLKLVFSASSTDSNLEFLKSLEIKIGNARIRPVILKQKGDNIEVIFNLPIQYKNTSYALPVFIKILPESRILETESKTPLIRIEWRF